jgi:hypothetical protein
MVCFIIFNPQIAYEINRFASQREEPWEMGTEKSLLSEDSDLLYTSIYHPKLVQKIDPEKYKEDKAFIIRRYTSPDEGSIMIVSEFEQEENLVPKKRYLNGI